MSDHDPVAVPPPRPEDRMREADGRREVAIALFSVLEVVLLAVLIYAAWGGSSDDAPAMGLGEGLAAIASAAAIPSAVFLVGALAIRSGRGAASVVASVVLVGIGILFGFVTTALVALTRIDAQEH